MGLLLRKTICPQETESGILTSPQGVITAGYGYFGFVTRERRVIVENAGKDAESLRTRKNRNKLYFCCAKVGRLFFFRESLREKREFGVEPAEVLLLRKSIRAREQHVIRERIVVVENAEWKRTKSDLAFAAQKRETLFDQSRKETLMLAVATDMSRRAPCQKSQKKNCRRMVARRDFAFLFDLAFAFP